MMTRMLASLRPDQFSAVQALFASMPHHLALTALLAGTVPGQVFAEGAGQPVSALAWVQQRLFAAGSITAAELAAALEAEVVPRAREAGTRYLALYAAPPAQAAAEAGLGTRMQPAGCRLYFERPAQAATGWRQRLPAGYELRPVDRALLAEAGLENLADLKTEMCSERPSVEAFLQQSFGVCALRGQALAGWCLSEYNHVGACEVGIEVLPDHRRLGLATTLTLALVERAAAEGLQRIGWHCYADNAGSVAAARAAGFAPVAEYPAWLVDAGPG